MVKSLREDLFFNKYQRLAKWENSDPHTYVILRDETNISQFNNKLNNWFQTKTSDSASSL